MNAIDASMVVTINRDTTGIPRNASVGKPTNGNTPTQQNEDTANFLTLADRIEG